MSIIYERAHRLVNLREFEDTGVPEKLTRIALHCPYERQYILRMPIRAEGHDSGLPAELEWVRGMYTTAVKHQQSLGTDHPFCYITVRHGKVESQKDDEWHVDGFSMKISHIPEQNYIWCSQVGTEYVPLKVKFPQDFDPLIHNIHWYLQRYVDLEQVASCETGVVYCLDPYLLHRRPPTTGGMERTFVRISFVPIEINDVNNTQNPALFRDYTQYGVILRNKLVEYPHFM